MNKCPNCGSSRLISDRALAGKIICRDCSMPIDKINSSSNSYKKNMFRKPALIYFGLVFITFAIIIIFS